MGWLRKLGAVLLGVACLFTPGAAAKWVASNPCDDGMHWGRLPAINSTFNDGSALKRVWNVTNDTTVLPDNVNWVKPYVRRVLTQRHIDTVMSWPRDAPPVTNCTLNRVTYNKLCVPKTKKNRFRVKVRLWTSCGKMLVKYRITIVRKKPLLMLWGRSKT